MRYILVLNIDYGNMDSFFILHNVELTCSGAVPAVSVK
jgi:hypothetical protein